MKGTYNIVYAARQTPPVVGAALLHHTTRIANSSELMN